MELILEILVQILFEGVLQIIFEFIVEFCVRFFGSSAGIQRPQSPIWPALGYILLAGATAAISIYIFPEHYIKDPHIRIVYLILMPIAVGFIMSLRGKLLERNHKTPIRLDSFFYGYAFALTFAILRYVFGV